MSDSPAGRRLLPLLLVLLITLAAPTAPTAPAATDSDSQQLTQLMQALAGVSHIKARFRDEKHSGILQFALVTEGRFEYRAPGFISRRVSVPEASLFEVDGDHIRIERDGKQTLIDTRERPMLAELLRAIRAILGGDLDHLRTLFSITISGDDHHWQLQLQPIDDRLAQTIELIEVRGQGRQVDALSLAEPSGDHTDTVFSGHQIR